MRWALPAFSLSHGYFLGNLDPGAFKFTLGALLRASARVKHENIPCDSRAALGVVLQEADLI